MEVRRFWFLNGQVERLRAEEQILFMRTSGSLTTAEGFEKTYDHYKETMGIVATFAEVQTHIDLDETKTDPTFDRAAFLAFRQKVGDNN